MKGGYQDEGVIIARSRWRWTIVVVRQFSLVAISANHPPAGIQCGVERAALRIPSHTGRVVWPVCVSLSGLFFVVMACSPGPFLYIPPGGLISAEDGPFSPVHVSMLPESGIHLGKRSGNPAYGQKSVYAGTSAWLSRVFCGTCTLIRNSEWAAHIMVKYAR